MLLPLAAAVALPAEAASAVAAAADATLGYAFNHRSEREAALAALRSCQRRTRSECTVALSCAGSGYGAIAFRRYPPGMVQAWGGSCGLPTPEAAYRVAIDQCNAKVKPARCGQPRTAWRDIQGFRSDAAGDQE
jgi:hypothetical protein